MTDTQHTTEKRKGRNNRNGCLTVRAQLHLYPKQKEAILKHFGVSSLSEAAKAAITETTGILLPDNRAEGKKELLVFDKENRPLYDGQPVTRKKVMHLLKFKNRQAAFELVKAIRADGFAIRGDFVFRLPRSS